MNPPVSFCRARRADQVPRPVTGVLDGSEHDRDIRPQADAVRYTVHFEPPFGVDLVRAQDRSDLIVEDLRRRAWQGAQPGIPELDQIRVQRLAEPARPFVDLERGEGMYVHALGTRTDRPQHLEVVGAVEVWVDPTLKADLGGAGLLRFDDAAGDLADLEQVGAATKVQRQRPLGERAELALERADVGVVDVPVDHEGDHIADR